MAIVVAHIKAVASCLYLCHYHIASHYYGLSNFHDSRKMAEHYCSAVQFGEMAFPIPSIPKLVAYEDDVLVPLLYPVYF